jgi:SAM-dependent methyltransferase
MAQFRPRWAHFEKSSAYMEVFSDRAAPSVAAAALRLGERFFARRERAHCRFSSALGGGAVAQAPDRTRQGGWIFACPECRAALVPAPDTVHEAARCPCCDAVYPRQDGVWRLLGRGRAEALRPFVTEYETVRCAEGRGGKSLRQLRALPFRDLSGRRRYEWRIRATSYAALVRRVLRPLERRHPAGLRVLDLGSGVGWLAYRLARRGHAVAAIDLATNDFDGLGAHRLYDRAFASVEAEFDRLPFVDGGADFAVYNASFHYATDFRATLAEAIRVLAPGGRFVILDSPIYRDPSSGAAMVREREEAFLKRYGFRGDALKSEGFLTGARLAALGRELDLEWETFAPWYGVRWWVKPWWARLRGGREPARFLVIVGRRRGEP